jgi:hypothetical protein
LFQVVDIEIDMWEETYYGDDIGFDYTRIKITVEAETLKAKKKRYFNYDLIQGS